MEYPVSPMERLDDPIRIQQLRATLRNKRALHLLYEQTYGKYQSVLDRCPKEGLAIELGSGGGFAKEVIPTLLTSDVLAYNGLDQVVDGTRMPFENESVRFIALQNVLHHIPDAERFFAECVRCLKPGGRVFILDQYPGWISYWIYRFFHHEPFDANAVKWSFPSQGPLTGANGALAWIIFERDRALFEKGFPQLKIVSYQSHSPLQYWLAGGLKPWTLVPGFLFKYVQTLDRFLIAMTTKWASFVDIELMKCP